MDAELRQLIRGWDPADEANVRRVVAACRRAGINWKQLPVPTVGTFVKTVHRVVERDVGAPWFEYRKWSAWTAADAIMAVANDHEADRTGCRNISWAWLRWVGKVEVSKLTRSEFNLRSDRFDPVGDDAHFVEHVATHGIIRPIHFTPDYVVTDGWVRVQACRHLDIIEIPALVECLHLAGPAYQWMNNMHRGGPRAER